MLKIVADDKIPYIRELFANYGEVIQKPGTSIQRHDLLDAQVLLTRTVITVNADLLQNTAVEFVGSATAGHDHLDHIWLEDAGIEWTHAPGAHAVAVAEYVIACVAHLRQQNILPKNNFRAAIIGVGRIGSCVVDRLTKIGAEVVLNDPPHAQRKSAFLSIPLYHLRDIDLICLHTPLTTTGDHPTYHLINQTFLQQLKPGCVLLNAARGAVVDNQALLANSSTVACLDVWEHEPKINIELLKKIQIATPHIAGYTKQAKLRATLAIYAAFLKHFQLTDIHAYQELQQLYSKQTVNIDGCTTWEEIILKIYNPHNDMQRMQESLLKDPNHVATNYENLRRYYHLRNEFSAINLTPQPPPQLRALLQQLNLR